MKRLVGSLERVALPVLNLYQLDAKVDTGADSSALHCNNIVDKGSNVSFQLLDEVHSAYNGKVFELPVADRKRVKSSNGIVSERIYIESVIVVGTFEKKTLISLTNRANMKHPMLLGKRFLQDDFLVDVTETNLQGKPL